MRLPHESETLVGFEALTAVVMKNYIFCGITPCSPFKVNRRFGGTSPSSSGSKNKLCLPRDFALVSCSAYWIIDSNKVTVLL
jgi:hypothetical protein